MKKGFTLIELMVVVLIVGILAAVAIPMMQGRINAAKWSEGKAGAGTVATALRAYAAEKGSAAAAAPTMTDLGFTANDLKGTYFGQGAYGVAGVAYDSTTGLLDATITVTAPTGITPGTKVLTIVDNVATWTEN